MFAKGLLTPSNFRSAVSDCAWGGAAAPPTPHSIKFKAYSDHHYPPPPRYETAQFILTGTKSLFSCHHLVVDVLNVVTIKK